MSNNKFEQLIELFINEDEKKAKELFHDIVVEKSRDIYADLIKEDEVEDIEENTEEEAVEESTDEEVEESTDEEVEEDLGGNETEDLINDIESDEEGLANEEATDEEVDELSDAIADLQAQFDEIVAMNDLETGDDDDDEGEDEMDMEMEMDAEDDMEESVTEEKIVEYAEKAPAPVSSEEGSVNTTAQKVPGGKPSSDAKPAISAGGADEKGSATPKYDDAKSTTKPDLKKV
jgi:hypothetical protein